jgi:hypothetical protein
MRGREIERSDQETPAHATLPVHDPEVGISLRKRMH